MDTLCVCVRARAGAWAWACACACVAVWQLSPSAARAVAVAVAVAARRRETRETRSAAARRRLHTPEVVEEPACHRAAAARRADSCSFGFFTGLYFDGIEFSSACAMRARLHISHGPPPTQQTKLRMVASTGRRGARTTHTQRWQSCGSDAGDQHALTSHAAGGHGRERPVAMMKSGCPPIDRAVPLGTQWVARSLEASVISAERATRFNGDGRASGRKGGL